MTSNVTYSGFNSTSAGTKTVTVTSKENTSVTTSFKVTVTAVTLTKIVVTTNLTKKRYSVGETHEPAGVKVTGI